MKRLLAIISLLAVAACAKAPKTQEVVFTPRFVESGSMVRATNHEEVLELIESTFPSVRPTLYYDDNTSVSIELGRAYMLKVGT